MAAKMVWYSFSWSPKVRVTPLSETVFVAARAGGPDRTHEAGGQAGREHEGSQRGGAP